MTPTSSADHNYHFHSAPIVIGGVGGSGTRLIAAILLRLGFFMGKDFNKANDNLAFTLLFKQSTLWPLNEHRSQIQQSIGIFLKAMYFRQALTEEEVCHVLALAGRARFNAPEEWLLQRARALIDAPTAQDPPAHWGWKEPNTHIFLPALIETIPDLKYIHVMRHGLDMAYSVNQAQLKFWGEALTGQATTDGGPEESFSYWCAAHKRVVEIGGRMGRNFLLLNFDEFCSHPQPAMANLLQFLGIEATEQKRQALLDMVVRPASIGRHRNEVKISPPAADLEFLRELGFD